MAHVDEVIVLDDDNDEEELKPHSSASTPPPHSSASTPPPHSSASTPPPHSSASTPPPSPSQSNGKALTDSERRSHILREQNNKLFEEFVDYCSSLTVEHPEVISFLKGKFSRANPSFLSSTEFCNVLGRCLTRVQNKRSKVFVYINELCTALKAHTQRRKVSLQLSSSLQPQKEDHDKRQDEEKEGEEVDKKDDSGDHRTKTGSKRQIRYLENLLRLYSREIQKLQEKELTLDEMEDEDSAYIQESRLKRKILRIFQKLCELKDCNSLTGRVIEQRIPYHGTRYPEVNRRLEKFINGSHDVFPDYGDVLKVIQKASEKHGLGISRKKMQGMAQDAFRELGNRLQERRHLDLVYNFGCHLTDSYKPGHDPANQDAVLQRRLRENRSIALTRLEDVIKKYAGLQDEGEEEDSKRRKKGNESPSSSRVEESRSSPAESPPSRESAEDEETEDDDEEESETDIEDDLKRSQELTGEEGDEEEEEQATDPDNEDDQIMEIPDTQPLSSKDNQLSEEGEEPTEKGSTPTSPPPVVQEEAPTTKVNLEAECPLTPSIQYTNSNPRQGRLSKEHDGLEKADTSSEETNRSDKVILQMENNFTEGVTLKGVSSIKIKVQKDNPIDVNACDVESDTNSDPGLLAISEDSWPAVRSRSANPVWRGTKSTAKAATNFSTLRLGNKRTSLLKDKSHSVTEVKASTPSTNIVACKGSCTQTEDGSTSDMDTNNFVSGMSSGKRQSKGDSLLNVDNGVGIQVSEVSHIGSSNGIVHVTTERSKSASLYGLQSTKDNAVQGHLGSSKSRQTKERSPLPRKRKTSPPHTLLENGKRALNGSGEMEKKCKKARNDSSNTCLPGSDPDDGCESSNITLDLVVTCSPPSIPTKQILKSNASTQCDPDEVIVLSD